MTSNARDGWWVAALIFAASLVCVADPGLPATKPATKARSEPAVLVGQLASSDKSLQDAALARIHEILGDGPDADTSITASKKLVDIGWVRSLMKVHRYDDAESLAMTGLLRQANDPAPVADYQRLRVDALLAAKKYDAALSAAKQLYNVCLMRSSSEAIDKLSVALVNARPTEHGIARKFKAQQVAAATTQPATQPGDAMAADNLLATIKVDSKPFDDAIANVTINDYDNLIAKGNLLLLADKPKEARDAFETALDLASGQHQSAIAIEAVARSIRAQAGGIGAANAYILSQREVK